jgi:uncharacterized protein (DUF1330 family)
MSAYVIVHGTPKDAEKMQAYGAAAGPIVAQHGGEVVARGPATVLSGTSAHKIAVVIKFPDAATAQAWYASPEYQALVPGREQALDSVFILAGE